MEYAKSLIKKPLVETKEGFDVGEEESWTFIGDESDPELVKRIADWEPNVRAASGMLTNQRTSMVASGSGPATHTSSSIVSAMSGTDDSEEKELHNQENRMSISRPLEFLRRSSREGRRSTERGN
jgi:hypothetical protein